MSDPSPIAMRDQAIDVEQEVSYQNGHNIDSIEHKIDVASSSDGFPPRTLIIKRKAKRKDDGPLEIVCGFIVEHQIGTMNNLRDYSRDLAN
jgi:acyl-CoA-dependent ceramide synthase